MAATAVYAADRLTDGKTITQAQVAAATSTIIDYHEKSSQPVLAGAA